MSGANNQRGGGRLTERCGDRKILSGKVYAPNISVSVLHWLCGLGAWRVFPTELARRFRGKKILWRNFYVPDISVGDTRGANNHNAGVSTADDADNTDYFSGIRGIRVIRGGNLCAAVVASIFALVSFAAPAQAVAQPELLPDKEVRRVFGGGARTVPVMWRNSGDRLASLALSTRLYQASSATAAPLGGGFWKELEILPLQTVLESVTLDFPAVRGETRFEVQWLQGSNTVLGTTEVWVYPTNLLGELGAIGGGEPVGLYDPQNVLKPLLRGLGVNCSDLETQGSERFVGKLVIVGPFESKAQVREWLPESIRVLARKGVGVVWLLPPLEPRGMLKPSFYTLSEGKGAVVVVQAGVIVDLAEEPQAQLNLVQLCRLALKPETNQLPLFATQP